ncbi:unnamed protein product, partial [Rotaria sp. Silwood2]
AGLSPNEYIRISNGMIKQWAAKIKVKKYNQMYDPIVGIESWDKSKGTSNYKNKKGCITSGNIMFYEGKKFGMYHTSKGLNWVEIEDINIPPPNTDDMTKFYTANIGHIGEEDIDDEFHIWVHSVRFWSIVGGLMSSVKNREFVVCEDPTTIDKKADEFVSFCINHAPNAWTAAVTRTTS